MTDQAPELLPCPFCGSPANLRRFAVSKDEHTKISNMVSHIQCVNDEGCKVTVDIQHMNEAVAIAAWNTRPPSERPPLTVADLLARPDHGPFYHVTQNEKDTCEICNRDYAERPVAQVREALEREVLAVAEILMTACEGPKGQLHPWKPFDFADVASKCIAALTAERPEAAVAWRCAARRQSLPEPADCNWPDCGCDPHATKVIEALLEQGWSAIPHEEPGRLTSVPRDDE